MKNHGLVQKSEKLAETAEQLEENCKKLAKKAQTQYAYQLTVLKEVLLPCVAMAFAGVLAAQVRILTRTQSSAMFLLGAGCCLLQWRAQPQTLGTCT